MNLALSDEQVFLREAARGALSRFKTLEAAREAKARAMLTNEDMARLNEHRLFRRAGL